MKTTSCRRISLKVAVSMASNLIVFDLSVQVVLRKKKKRKYFIKMKRLRKWMKSSLIEYLVFDIQITEVK